MITIAAQAGEHISKVCKRLVDAAAKGTRAVVDFNGVEVFADIGDSVDVVLSRYNVAWQHARDQYTASEEGKQAAAREREAVIKEAAREAAGAVHDEAAMRAEKPPACKTVEELAAYIDSLVKGKHTYGTCAYAMALAAQAAFEYVARELGTTGFQCSCADLAFLGKVRNINGPFILLKASDALYPQYDLHQKLNEAMREWQPWLKEEAQKRLAVQEGAASGVVAHWEKLAGVI